VARRDSHAILPTAALPALVLVATTLAGGCGSPPARENEAMPASEQSAPAGASVVDALAAGTIADPAQAAMPQEIHYDLTAYDWYRRGEPLVHQSRPYRPVGPPVPTPEQPLELAGRYGGVTYYIVSGTAQPQDTLYVPVFEGYWLRFAVQ